MMRLSQVLFLAFFSFAAQAATIIPAPPQIAAKAWLLVDADSGEVLAEHNADLPLPPASLTKMMTSYVLAAEIAEGNVAETDMVAISENAWSQNPRFAGSSLMWIEPGKDVSIGDLQRGIIISSGNDSTVAVAEHLAGSEEVFAQMMNSHAERLGMVDTFYVNTHGLPHPEHLTTARDLATLANAMIKEYPEQYAIYKEREFTYNDIKQYNRNSLLGEDPTVDGMKTGYTKEAGYCLVASAERRGMRLISVVMGASSPRSRKNETRSLLNYGFRFFETTTLFESGQELDQPRIWKGQEDYVPVGILDEAVVTLPRGKKKHLVSDVQINEDLEAPLAIGDEVGTVIMTLDGETVYTGPVVALQAVEPGGFFARIWDMILMWIAGLFKV
ncbi:serine-type D-Ala-D-Ala carboxypeptidase [Halioglobus japonicus]|uniref:serine-type D-Ala-D-Ala carboxypeptidase n=1 Tax=Halioglobus japonicus TaxID=930805 RepID=A0AAP8MDX1_9GAMM|nr:D-alanyl-D-alanine carboxypeptidase family protein [Halioglobus japonicus]AQA18010.1 serine-type D-Ala-D-Ala carboxypeptidase [Halioglobus japonicus]PLW86001.1 D-alanyl-D-alanine carboxypeptidase [Halioglobus japonicus]GHD15006.1 D-alanyl-D-alanine carboxypeptidase [Halioglobus japonicus]